MQYVVMDLEIGQPIKLRIVVRNCDGVARESKGVKSCPRGMREICTSGSMSGDAKRSVGHRTQATAPILDSTTTTWYSFEVRGGTLDVEAIQRALETADVIFIEANDGGLG
jgi:hypothetical protein